jgi:DNA invertase Pin-like site-specific DNA recombinase
MLRAFGYVRISRLDQAESIEAQRQTIRQYSESRLKERGFERGGFFEDDATSGNKELRCRTAGFKLNLELEAGDVAAFASLEQSFSGVHDAASVIVRWLDRGINVHILDLNIDSATEFGEAFVRLLKSYSDSLRVWRSKRAALSIAQRKSQGRPNSGKSPYGFKLIGPRGNRRYAPDPFTRRIGQWVVRWRLAGKTWDELYWGLIRKGVRNKNGR